MKKSKRVMLREKRLQMGLSLSAMGEKLETSKQHLSDIENGKKDPSLDLALKIAEFLNGTVEYFFGQRSA